MLKLFLRCILSLAVALACMSPAAAQRAPDPLTRFLDSIFKPNAVPPASGGGEATQSPQTAPAPQAKPAPARPRPQAPPQARAKKDTSKKAVVPDPEPQRQTTQPQTPAPQPTPQTASKPEPQAQPQPRSDEREKTEARPAAPEQPKPVSEPEPPAQAVPEQAAEEPQPVVAAPKQVAEPPKPARSTPAQTAPAPTSVAAPASPSTPTSPPVPSSPAAALNQVNAYFNSIDQLSAYFVQKNPNGQQAEGTLSVRRPGQLHFAYTPPSTLEIVSDGRNVAIRDKKLGTNDVYPVGQTPLKFLLQENVDLARDTKVRDVQVGRDGMVTVRFDDSATLGGTSKITLRFDSRANALKQWTIVDAQGYETSVTLSGLNVVHRRDARAAN
jgi:outer membrane lipoprotein-sorting protein